MTCRYIKHDKRWSTHRIIISWKDLAIGVGVVGIEIEQPGSAAKHRRKGITQKCEGSWKRHDDCISLSAALADGVPCCNAEGVHGCEAMGAGVDNRAIEAG